MSRPWIVLCLLVALPHGAFAQEPELERLSTRASKGEKSSTLRQDLMALPAQVPRARRRR